MNRATAAPVALVLLAGLHLAACGQAPREAGPAHRATGDILRRPDGVLVVYAPMKPINECDDPTLPDFGECKPYDDFIHVCLPVTLDCIGTASLESNATTIATTSVTADGRYIHIPHDTLGDYDQVDLVLTGCDGEWRIALPPGPGPDVAVTHFAHDRDGVTVEMQLDDRADGVLTDLTSGLAGIQCLSRGPGPLTAPPGALIGEVGASYSSAVVQAGEVDNELGVFRLLNAGPPAFEEVAFPWPDADGRISVSIEATAHMTLDGVELLGDCHGTLACNLDGSAPEMELEGVVDSAQGTRRGSMTLRAGEEPGSLFMRLGDDQVLGPVPAGVIIDPIRIGAQGLESFSIDFADFDASDALDPARKIPLSLVVDGLTTHWISEPIVDP